MESVNSLIRKNIRELKPYSSARDEFEGDNAVFLDANENPYFRPLNRYPDPRQRYLKKVISDMTQLPADNIFAGNGSDEAIDLLMRAFCEPGTDNVVAPDPSYGMYEVAAAINGAEYRKAQLNEDFSLNTEALREVADGNTRIIFLCSPNNPTGNSFMRSEVLGILDWFGGILVIDEAYIDFSGTQAFIDDVLKIPNLVVLRTLSKAWGRAGIRLGMAFAGREIIDVLNKIKPPYNVNSLTIDEAVRTLHDCRLKDQVVAGIIDTRSMLFERLNNYSFVKKVYPSDANFILVKVDDAEDLYSYLVDINIIVRNRSSATGCSNCLRITVGSHEETDILLDALGEYERSHKNHS
ncbi:MAG: histidinol-phosphate transaminase [Marinilabiliales bacterium]|nr:MAG: histidinol-phosphate transaminase [Marinilabiliales bacterium]